jgi:1-phosphofructokinase family hexose kinase
MEEREPLREVLCLGLTPALQRTIVTGALVLGEVNRASQVVESAGGKAVTAARALVSLGTPVQACGFNGGATGKQVISHMASSGLGAQALTKMASSTRVCTTLIDRATATVTELVEEAPDPGPRALARFVRYNMRRVQRASMLVISGTLPPFVADDFYRRFVQEATRAEVPILVDSQGTALLSALQDGPVLVKMTASELAVTTRSPMDSEEGILRAIRHLIALGARGVLVTRGGRTAYLMTKLQAWRLSPPTDEVLPINPIGSGDCVSAGIAHALLSGTDLCESVRFGMGCGSANVETLVPADFDFRRATELARGVGVTEI